ncbi:MAG: energy transducer TonB [Candidatus Sulfotelmatobacter sp.]|jgi:TonB family protein
MLFVRRRERLEKNLRRLSSAIFVLVLCTTAAFAPPLLAQKTAKSSRKVIVFGKPDYPEVLKRAQVGGVCHLKATVQPNGSVSSVEILGGNPILAESAVAAVKGWKYAPAPSETNEDVFVTFNPK